MSGHNASSHWDITEVLIPQGEPEVVIYHGGQGALGIQGVRGRDEASLFNLPGLR